MLIKNLIFSLPPYISKPITKLMYYALVILWYIKGKPIPPPHLLKIQAISKFAEGFKTKILIETGTYLGETISQTKDYFQKIYSIELSPALAKKAEKLFRKDKKINIIQGDSSVKLPLILKTIKKPCLFWLDAHYSGGITAKGNKETPIVKEIKAILNHKVKKHVILIDDARCFNGKNDYPKFSEIKKLVNKSLKNYNVIIETDIIRIHPIKNSALFKNGN